jgi:hypothetical protein
MTYRRLWAACWGAVVALGVCWAAVVLPAPGGIVVTAVGGVFVALACAALDDAPEGELRIWPSARTWRRKAWGGPACLALVGVLATAPWLAVLLLVAAAVTSPPAAGRVRGSLARRGRSTRPGPRSEIPPGAPATPFPELAQAAPAPDRVPDPVLGLPDGVLARLWAESYRALRAARSPQERLLVVELRSGVLDELHRRHPTAMSRWLEAGGHPQDCPVRFRRRVADPRRSPRPEGDAGR